MSLFPVFKVNKVINKGDIDVIYVFCGHLDINVDELENLFAEIEADDYFFEDDEDEDLEDESDDSNA